MKTFNQLADQHQTLQALEGRMALAAGIAPSEPDRLKDADKTLATEFDKQFLNWNAERTYANGTKTLTQGEMDYLASVFVLHAKWSLRLYELGITAPPSPLRAAVESLGKSADEAKDKLERYLKYAAWIVGGAVALSILNVFARR